MPESEFEQLLLETQRRQRRKTDLSEFEASLKEMMELNISLPVMLTWLEQKGKVTTLPALRRYVRRVFGEDYYDEFVRRNGWHRNKEPKPVAVSVQGNKEESASNVEQTASEIPAAPESGVDALKSILRGGIDTSEYD